MAERTIYGVDFSGAGVEGKTWIAEGRLPLTGHPTIDHIYPILRDDLYELLQNASSSTVVALDFPFGLPRVFLESLGIRANTMAEVWARVANIDFDRYKGKCKNFGHHPKRMCDRWYPASMSSLNSRLVPMTYRGIEMLHKLSEAYPNRWWVPPMDCGQDPVERVTLLEVMPGALLQSIGLDYATVKGYKAAAGSLDTREIVMNRLSNYAKAELEMPNLLDFRRSFRANDDCLDAAIAAVAAMLWARNPVQFRHPNVEEQANAQLEGCIYAPTPQVGRGE